MDEAVPHAQRSLITQPSGTPPASKLLSAGLRKLLTEGEDSGGACRLIALNATLRAECERVLPVLEHAKTPASRDEVLEVTARRMAAYGVTANLAFSHGVTWDSYVSGLEGLPLYAIEDAFDRWDRGEGCIGRNGVPDMVAASFPPRPPQIALLAQTAKAEIWMASYRARKALEHVERTAPRQIPEEERKAVAQQLAELAKSMGAKRMPGEHTPTQSPQEVASQLRRASATQPDVGDVV